MITSCTFNRLALLTLDNKGALSKFWLAAPKCRAQLPGSLARIRVYHKECEQYGEQNQSTGIFAASAGRGVQSCLA